MFTNEPAASQWWNKMLQMNVKTLTDLWTSSGVLSCPVNKRKQTSQPLKPYVQLRSEMMKSFVAQNCSTSEEKENLSSYNIFSASLSKVNHSKWSELSSEAFFRLRKDSITTDIFHGRTFCPRSLGSVIRPSLKLLTGIFSCQIGSPVGIIIYNLDS